MARRKIDHRNQLALDFSTDSEASDTTEVANDVREDVTMNLIPNTLVSPEATGEKQQVIEIFDKWGIPTFNQARIMDFWKVGPYEDWCGSTRPITGDKAERISLIAQIDEYLGSVFESYEEGLAWLKKPSPYFDGVTPLAYMSSRRSKVVLTVSMRLFLMKMGVKK